MERERLTRLVQEPGKVTREDLAGLQALAAKYPWFSGAQLLRTAGERLGGEVLFDETLRTTSAHLPSRAALFDLTTQRTQRSSTLQVVRTPPIAEPAPPSPKVELEPISVPPVELPPTAVLPPLTTELPLDPPSSVVLEPTPEPATPQADLPQRPVLEDMVEMTREVPVTEPSNTLDPIELELDQQIMQAALASAYDLTWSEPAAVPLDTARTAVPSAEIPAPPPAPVHARTEPRSRMRFTDWLDAANEPAPTSARIAPPKPAPPVPPLGEQLPPAALIDRFMRQEIPDPPPKTAFFTPQQAGKRSLEDTAGLVTETLARIYEKQGNLPKAIDTYRRLSLKYPEKGAYFAALQKALEEQQSK